MEANFAELLPVLAQRGVRFIVIGGGAAIAHGSARLTSDVDVVYSRDSQNIRNLAATLQDCKPYLRGAPPDLPFFWDENTIKSGLNFTLTTTLGDLDLLGEVTGGGSYDELLPFSEEMDVFGIRCRFVTLEKLIQLKRAAGRHSEVTEYIVKTSYPDLTSRTTNLQSTWPCNCDPGLLPLEANQSPLCRPPD